MSSSRTSLDGGAVIAAMIARNRAGINAGRESSTKRIHRVSDQAGPHSPPDRVRPAAAIARGRVARSSFGEYALAGLPGLAASVEIREAGPNSSNSWIARERSRHVGTRFRERRQMRCSERNMSTTLTRLPIHTRSFVPLFRLHPGGLP